MLVIKCYSGTSQKCDILREEKLGQYQENNNDKTQNTKINVLGL